MPALTCAHSLVRCPSVCWCRGLGYHAWLRLLLPFKDCACHSVNMHSCAIRVPFALRMHMVIAVNMLTDALY